MIVSPPNQEASLTLLQSYQYRNRFFARHLNVLGMTCFHRDPISRDFAQDSEGSVFCLRNPDLSTLNRISFNQEYIEQPLVIIIHRCISAIIIWMLNNLHLASS